MSSLSEPSKSTAVSISSRVDMPVERITGRPVARSFFSRPKSVSAAEGTVRGEDVAVSVDCDADDRRLAPERGIDRVERAAERGLLIPSYPALDQQQKVPAAWLLQVVYRRGWLPPPGR